MNTYKTLLATLALGSAALSTQAATNDMVIQTKKLGAPIHSTSPYDLTSTRLERSPTTHTLGMHPQLR